MTVLYATAAGSTNINDHMTQDFAFVAAYINSTRQYGKCLNFIVKYRYIGNHYFDYKPLRETLLYYSEPTPELPIAVYWEIVNKAFVKNISSRYDLEGISSQIQVLYRVTDDIAEPGTHGSIITLGSMVGEPASAPWINNFNYDCTQREGPAWDGP